MIYHICILRIKHYNINKYNINIYYLNMKVSCLTISLAAFVHGGKSGKRWAYVAAGSRMDSTKIRDFVEFRAA